MTLIVLLILAGVSIGAVVGNQGIFKKAEQGAEIYNRGKAKEKLELTLSDAQVIKYTEGLTDEQLTDKINEIGEEIEERENPDISQAIVDGYIFSVDRTVPKILDYLGPADGIIITASINGNKNGWFKQGDTINVTVTGKIKTYSGGTITTVSATKGETAIAGFSIDAEGRYTIDNITSDTTIVINAEDSKGKKGSKTIPITIRIDTISPVVDNVSVEAKALKIIFGATGHDNESGLKHFNYTISSTQDIALEGIPENKRTGTFKQGEIVEIVTMQTGDREETTYTITITATDNADNTTLSSNAKSADVTTIDGITIAEAKELVNKDTLKDYIGKRVTDYNPIAGGKWRIFYYDFDGRFDQKYDIYIKRDCGTENVSVDNRINNFRIGEFTRKINPSIDKWYEHGRGLEYQMQHLANESDYYKGKGARIAWQAPSVELFIAAYNTFISGSPDLGPLYVKIWDHTGLAYIHFEGCYVNSRYPDLSFELNPGPRNVFLGGEKIDSKYWLCTTVACYPISDMFAIDGSAKNVCLPHNGGNGTVTLQVAAMAILE